jgi:hypothetical protein
MTLLPIPALFAPLGSPTLTDRVMASMFDDTFKGIHHLAPFDYAILVPYFTVLIILSFYGLHRYKVIHEYFKHGCWLRRPRWIIRRT